MSMPKCSCKGKKRRERGRFSKSDSKRLMEMSKDLKRILCETQKLVPGELHIRREK